MKYLKTYPDRCIGCHTCEEVCSELFFKETNTAKSCIRIIELSKGFDITVCNQCGECVKMCPTQAITINNLGVVMINKSLCIGCFNCVAECPTNVMRYYHNMQTPFKCIACGACVAKCPVNALEIIKEA
ncbi:MAG: 4Fe-4S binding protein [Candidatus Cloacimonetes bacterium]|nr:4Fe-4S binding protein [Candidatus Cloacimonadota bacterium]